MTNATFDNHKCGPRQKVVKDDEEPSAQTESGWVYTRRSELYRLVAGKPESDLRERNLLFPPPQRNWRIRDEIRQESHGYKTLANGHFFTRGNPSAGGMRR